MKESVYNGKKIMVEDATPTWSGILNWLLAALEDGNAEGKAAARKELRNMAIVADRYVDLTKDKLVITWSADDVIEQAIKDGKSLTEDQAKRILKIVEDDVDSTIGVNWDTISHVIDMYLNKQVS